jgi:hypothetical protein
MPKSLAPLTAYREMLAILEEVHPTQRAGVIRALQLLIGYSAGETLLISMPKEAEEMVSLEADLDQDTDG